MFNSVVYFCCTPWSNRDQAPSTDATPRMPFRTPRRAVAYVSAHINGISPSLPTLTFVCATSNHTASTFRRAFRKSAPHSDMRSLSCAYQCQTRGLQPSSPLREHKSQLSVPSHDHNVRAAPQNLCLRYVASASTFGAAAVGKREPQTPTPTLEFCACVRVCATRPFHRDGDTSRPFFFRSNLAAQRFEFCARVFGPQIAAACSTSRTGVATHFVFGCLQKRSARALAIFMFGRGRASLGLLGAHKSWTLGLRVRLRHSAFFAPPRAHLRVCAPELFGC
jgi:hypothetical protein